MIIPKYIPIYFLVVFQFHSNIVLSQRSFANPAVTNPAPCACNLRAGACDPNCCCDSDCSAADLSVSPICKSIQTVSSYSTQEQSLQTWDCSNSTSAALYDYFPFVCVQLTFNEIIGNYYSTDNVEFLNTPDGAANLRSTFVSEYPELFQLTTLSSPTFTESYSIGAPVFQSPSIPFTLPGNLAGLDCQDNVQVLFGVNRDVSCTLSSLTQDLCTHINNVTSLLQGGGTTSTVNTTFFNQTYTPTSSIARDFTTEYYFQDQYSETINNITYNNTSINDYCLGYHPITRTQRYGFTCASPSNSSTCNQSQYQVWSACPTRDNLQYSTIDQSFFTTVRASSIDDPINFADFDNTINATNGLSIPCVANDIRRVLYRIGYSSINNTILSVQVFVLLQSSSNTSRITIQWNDIATTTTSGVPRGYRVGEPLQFLGNNSNPGVSNLVPTSSGLCVDATRQGLNYKQSTSSYCFIQLTESTIQQCHNLKLNMYLYLNVFYAPATYVRAYPNSNVSLVPIRDVNQDLSDLDRIDETRPNNRLNITYIEQTRLTTPTYTIYDTTQILPVCYNVPSGIYIEFRYVRINISSTVSYEQIVSVQYNYTYSNWQFDCTTGSCANTSTQRYLVSFQSAFVDYTNVYFNYGDTTTADITSADNYIQQLLWLITSEYNGEPGYRNYTIGMILIFIGISVIVMHILLFGLMFPF